MDINYITNKIQGRIPEPLDANRRYSVLIPLIKIGDQLHIIFEVRARALKTQPGEISFPGGRVEEEETYKEAAVRETMEELNLMESNISVIGELNYLVSYANLIIHCFAGVINGVSIEEIKPNGGEVDHIFTVPLKFFLSNEPDRYELALETVQNDEFPYNLIPGGRKYNWRSGKHSVLFYKYNSYIIWGFTARMMNHFVEIIKDRE